MRGLYTEDRPDPREIDWLGYYKANLKAKDKRPMPSDQQPLNHLGKLS